METFDRITIEPGKMGGRPCIRGMRLTVRRVLEVLATYPERADIARNYPELEDEDIRQALLYAAGNLDEEVRRRVAWLEQDPGVRSRVEAAMAYICGGGKGVRPREAKNRAV